MSSNIIYITWNNSYAISREIERWVKVFEMKHGKENIDRFTLDDRSKFSMIRDNILSSGLFSSKRLFIFSGGIEKKNPHGGGFEDILERIKDSIPEDHFLLFHNISEKEEWLRGSYDPYKKTSTLWWLGKNEKTERKEGVVEIRKLDSLWDENYWMKEYPSLDERSIREVLRKYREGDATQELQEKNPNIGHLIAHTFEMIYLASENGERKFDENLIFTEWWYTSFNLVDAITEERYDTALTMMKRMNENTKSKDILRSLIFNLRNTLYIKYLAWQGKNLGEIGEILGIHPYPLKKNWWSPISEAKIKHLYQKLVKIDRAYKSGKWVQDDELWRIFSIELVLLELKK